MIDGSKKRNRQLAFELQNLHVCENRSKTILAAQSRASSLGINQSDIDHSFAE